MPRRDDDLADDAQRDPTSIPVEMPPADVFVTWEQLRAKLVELEKHLIARIQAQLDDIKARHAEEHDDDDDG